MWTMIIKRLFRGLITVSIVIVLIFIIMRIAPSDPAALLAGAEASEEDIEQMREMWGLNKPYIEQFWMYLKALLSGDAGLSFQYSANGARSFTVVELVKSRFPNTIKLAITAITFAVVLAVPTGIICGLYKGSWFDNAVMAFGFMLKSVPVFYVGILMINFFAIKLNILPSGGNDSWKSIILPAIATSMHFTVVLTRTTRSEVIQILKSDYIKTVRAKGLSNKAVLFVHCLRNAAIPIVTLIGIRFGGMLGGSVVTEALFRWPGIGQLLINSVNTRDYPTVQFLVPYIAIVFIVINIIVDVLYGILDPRIRREK